MLTFLQLRSGRADEAKADVVRDEPLTTGYVRNDGVNLDTGGAIVAES